ncbi:hypothetical protein ACFV3Q_35910 [Streptomyces mexicanus]|uniref:hypothetical protein n=1 Tax=Streptomyces mexicanus TaxID=178566 RepID=UPI003659896C
MSVPRLERSTTRLASTKMAARNPSHLGSPAQPGRRSGVGTGVLGIGSGVHDTPDLFHQVLLYWPSVS